MKRNKNFRVAKLAYAVPLAARPTWRTLPAVMTTATRSSNPYAPSAAYKRKRVASAHCAKPATTTMTSTHEWSSVRSAGAGFTPSARE